MARNQEKALTLFNKWQTFKQDFHSNVGNRRPLLAGHVDSLPDCQTRRREIVHDLTKKMAAIQNASLGEHRIRELNDEINKLMKQKYYWELRIRELGGDAVKRGFHDVDGWELPGAPGYRYYGAAKELPGVRELFAENDETKETKKTIRTRADIFKNITPDYYGYRDDDDGILAVKEAEREYALVSKAVLEKGGTIPKDGPTDAELISNEKWLHSIESSSSSVLSGDPTSSGSSSGSISVAAGGPFVELPSQEAMNALLVEQRKKLAMEKLALL